MQSAIHVEPEAAELERIADEIAALSAHLDAATARLLDLIREFDAREGWGTGFRNCAHWLTWRVGLDPSAARERVRVARALGTLPGLARALAQGELSYSKVRALTRIATPETEERLLKIGGERTAADVERIVRAWRYADRNEEAKQAGQRHRNRALHIYDDEDGMVAIHGRLEPETGAVLRKALEAARELLYRRRRADASAETVVDLDVEGGVVSNSPTRAQQLADALVLVAEAALHHELDSGAPAERHQVVVHVDAPVLADANAPGQTALQGGTHVSAETSQRLACDATRVVMWHDPDGGITEVGARTRTIPPAFRRALQHRDKGCRFPGCGLPFGQGHHIEHWARGGPTTLSNLTMLCRRHHRAVHEEGYQVERKADGTLRFTHPHGFVVPDVPPQPEVPVDPAEALRAQNEARGVAINMQTPMVPLMT